MFSTTTSSARQEDFGSLQSSRAAPPAQPSIGTSVHGNGTGTGVPSLAEMARIRGGRIRGEEERQLVAGLPAGDVLAEAPATNYEKRKKDAN